MIKSGIGVLFLLTFALLLSSCAEHTPATTSAWYIEGFESLDGAAENSPYNAFISALYRDLS